MSRRPRLKLVVRTPSSKEAMAAFEPAKSARDAEWVEEALHRGRFGRVSGVVPSEFEACVAILHPAWRCVCTKDNLSDFQAGRGESVSVRWSDVAVATVPVVYGRASRRVLGISMSRPTQYRRLCDGGWIVDPISGEDGLPPLIRPGDVWISAPRWSLHRDSALSLAKLLRAGTSTPASCWFGIWDGLGCFSEEDRCGASISTLHRRWLLYRGAVDKLTYSIHPRFELETANLVWPQDRSWCLAKDVSAECTLVAGSRELISAIGNEPGLEVQALRPEDRLPRLGDVLVPVIQSPQNLTLPPAFEAREDQYPFNEHRTLRRGPRMRALRWWLRGIRSIHIKKRKGND